MTNTEIRKEMIIARDEYIQLIRSELLGPGSEFNFTDAEHELISSNPKNRYSIGILYPQGNQINQDSDETVPLDDDADAIFINDDTLELVEQDEDLNGMLSSQDRNYEYDETANENLDEEINMSAQFMPSSMGITFMVRGNTDVVRGSASFATYRKAKLSDCLIPFELDNYSVPEEFAEIIVYERESKSFSLRASITAKEVKCILDKSSIEKHDPIRQIAYRFAALCKNGYVRVPHKADFTLDFSQSDYIDSNRCLAGTYAKISALRTRVSNELWSLTVMLVNDSEEVPAQAQNCIFQPVIRISSEENDFVFIESNPDIDPATMDDEERSLDLLYRNKKIYGTGLGVSVEWDIDEEGNGSIWSEFMPVAEVPPMSFDLPPNERLTSEKLSMKYLSDLDFSDKTDKLSSLTILVDLYRDWVEDLKSIAKTLDERYQSAAANNVAGCENAYRRMYEGIKVLEEDPIAYHAFVLANRAMFMQRVHLRMQARTSDVERYPGDEQIARILRDMTYFHESDDDCRWRPFQLAFILLNIKSIVSDVAPDRDIVDLIWFPTGGGKTEAYLGLTAFTIFYRRLANSDSCGGTAVIMRYTLRLLTAQQFTRAATLICACEHIRRGYEAQRAVRFRGALGKEPITIGLWIGRAHTPNTNKEAKKQLCKLSEVEDPSQLRIEKDRHNKFQVLKCPWCGTKLVKDAKDKKIIGKWGYSMRDEKRFYMYCPQEECDFTSRLPIQVVDEELYESPPTLLFGTVDKFAMLPWDSRVGAFFGVGSNNRAPELIIQDELHLISGALGTIVGLYETAVDAICSHKGIRPKIVASTATIRKAKEQCSVLYNRDVFQFPPPGLNAEDSFFAREAEISYSDCVFGRKYVGFSPSGKTKAMMETRAMAALLQRIYMMKLPDQVKDKMWTLTVYFNSLKDLGKAYTLVMDDVKDFIIRTANRLFASRRLIISPDELTSRITTTELNETLDKLEKLEYSYKNIAAKRYASNILLATNMISVGIDVARLNVMLLIGQPKLTSEYIQASSRVGRSFPGVVFVQFDATKSRDRSHYERFKAYHDSFYRFVEPTGATPFSKPARERALHAVLVSIIRQLAGLSEDRDAISFDKEYFADVVEETERFITERVHSINLRDCTGLQYDVSKVKEEIMAFINEWQDKVERSTEEDIPLFFGRRFMVSPPGESAQRLLRPYNSDGCDNSIETLTSMRNVDAPVRGKVIIWED